MLTWYSSCSFSFRAVRRLHEVVDLSLETGWQGRCRPQLGKLAEAELGSPGCGGETLLRADDVIAKSLQPVLLLAFFFSQGCRCSAPHVVALQFVRYLVVLLPPSLCSGKESLCLKGGTCAYQGAPVSDISTLFRPSAAQLFSPSYGAF
jgi:hypothetical protein